MKIIRPKSKQPIPENAKKVFDGVIFDVYQWEQKMYDGSVAVFEKIKRLDTTVIVAIDENNNFIITHQEQPGRDKPFLSNPAGRIEGGENPLEGAKRELLEETGYESND